MQILRIRHLVPKLEPPRQQTGWPACPPWRLEGLRMERFLGQPWPLPASWPVLSRRRSWQLPWALLPCRPPWLWSWSQDPPSRKTRSISWMTGSVARSSDRSIVVPRQSRSARHCSHVQTRQPSRPALSRSCGRSRPMNTILLILVSPGAHLGPTSLPIIWCTPWKMTLRSMPITLSTPL